uniref:Uncharacterized protein n=1 Tax=Clastoptera arizonana TaxID=38151 RepID=A0A1B6CXL2_9HEMI
MGRVVYYCLLNYLLLSGIVHQNNKLGHTYGESLRKENIVDRAVSQASNEYFSNHSLTDSNYAAPDLKSNQLPLKDLKVLTLENIQKNLENPAYAKIILKRSITEKGNKRKCIHKENELKEKQNKNYGYKKNKNNDLKLSRKSKRMENEDENEENENVSRKASRNNKTILKNKDDEDINDIPEEDDTYIYDDSNTESTENDDYDEDENEDEDDPKQTELEEKNNIEKVNELSIEDPDTNFKAKTDIERNKIKTSSQKINDKNQMSVLKNKHKIYKKTSKYNDDIAEINSDWNIYRKNKIYKALAKKKKLGDEQKFHKGYDEKVSPTQITEKELKVSKNWKHSSDPNIYNSATLTKNNKFISHIGDGHISKFKSDNEFLNEEQLDYNEEEKEKHINQEEKEDLDDNEGKLKSKHFLAKDSKFSVDSKGSNKKLYLHTKKNVVKNVKSSDPDRTLLKHNCIHRGRKNMNNFDKIRRHSSLGNKKSDNSILKLEENDFDLLDVVPFVKNVEKVYKLDPIDGKIVLENITKVIKKRNDIVNSLTDIKNAASHQGN